MAVEIDEVVTEFAGATTGDDVRAGAGEAPSPELVETLTERVLERLWPTLVDRATESVLEALDRRWED